MLQIQCFGKPKILLDNAPLKTLASTKSKAVIYYLAATQEPASRARLAGLLWSDVSEKAARASLRVVLSKLRSQLHPHLTITRQDVSLNLGECVQIDLDYFQGRHDASMRQAADHYLGPFLDDFFLQDAQLFDEWVARKRYHFHQTAIDYLNRLATIEADLGNLPQAIQDCRTLLNIEPWHEESHQKLMRLLMQSGQQTAALAQFEQCCQALRSGLDVEPSHKTVQLYTEIKAGNKAVDIHRPSPQTQRSAQPAAHPNNLPIAALSFVGRQAEAEKVIQQLNNPQCSLLTLTGGGGIGKTRLAIECAHRLSPSYTDGVFLVQLAGLSSVELLPTSIANTLNLSLQGYQSPQEQLLSYLAEKQMLLLLDNFEHLLGGIGLITDLLEAAPSIKLLITSREPLGMSSEWVLPLTGLPHAAELQQPAAQLFIHRAQRLDLSFVPENEAAEIIRICQLVEGMPLAIELASAWVRVISCYEIGAEIENNLDFLTTDLDLVPPHQRSIRAVFDYSWSLLPQDAQVGFAKLSIFKGGFTRQSAESVAGVSLRMLTMLVDKSLLQKGSHNRFNIHPLLRQFAFEQLGTHEKEVITISFVRYFAHLLNAKKDDMYTKNDLDLLDWIQTEIKNIWAVWDWLTEHPAHEVFAQQMLTVTGYYFHRRSLYHEGAQLFEKILSAGIGWSPECRARFLIQSGSYDWQLGRFDQGERKLMAAIPILQRADEVGHAADGLLYLGILCWRKGDFTAALDYLHQAQAQFLLIGDEKKGAEAQTIIGFTQVTQGDYALGKVSLEAALTIHQKYEYHRGVGRIFNSLGSLHNRQEQYDISIKYYEQALEFVYLAGETVMTAATLSNLGSACRGLKRFEDALDYFQQSLPLTVEAGHSRWIATNYNEIGLTYLRMGQHDLAAKHFKQGFDLTFSIDAITDALTAMVGLSEVAYELDHPLMAATWLTFAHNRPELSAHVRRQGEKTSIALTGVLSDLDKQSILEISQHWSFEDAKRSIETAFDKKMFETRKIE